VDKNCNITKIDMAFIATNVEIVSNDPNPDRDLNRQEFYEILVRLAIEKYKRPGLVRSASAALEKLLLENVFPNLNPTFQWQFWRNKYLWTLDVDEVFKLNLAGLRKIFDLYTSFNKRWLTLADAT